MANVKSAKVKTRGINMPVPQDDSEAREAIREIGDLNREALRLEAEMNDQIARLQQAYGERVAPITDQVVARQEGLKMFAEAHRARLTGGGKVKYHRFATGEISWRTRPAKVTIRGKDAVIDAIKAARLGKKFLRIKEEINKDAMLEEDNRQIAAALTRTGARLGGDRRNHPGGRTPDRRTDPRSPGAH